MSPNQTPDKNTTLSMEEQLDLIMGDAAALGLTNNDEFMVIANPAMFNHDPYFIALLKDMVDQKLLSNKINGFPFAEPSENVSRPLPDQKPILLGKIQEDEKRPFIYDINKLNQHMLVLGGSGVGKTVLLTLIILQSIMSFVSVLIFDHLKQDFRHLKRFKCARDLIVIKPQVFPFNFLQPPTGVSIQAWIVTFVTTFCKYNDLLSGSEGFLIKTLMSLFQDFGIFNGKDKYPTIPDLFEKIYYTVVKGNSRIARFKDTILNRLEAYLSLMGNASEFSKGVPIEWIAKKNIVFELSALTEHISRFYEAMILQALFHFRIATNTRGNIIRNLVINDECKYLTPPGYNPNLSFSPLTTLLSQAREAGIGMVLSDQTAQLEDSVFVNSRIKICFRLGDGADIMKVAQSMSLDKEQQQFISMLDTGECIVRVPNEKPFVIKTFPVNIE